MRTRLLTYDNKNQNKQIMSNVMFNFSGGLGVPGRLFIYMTVVVVDLEWYTTMTIMRKVKPPITPPIIAPSFEPSVVFDEDSNGTE